MLMDVVPPTAQPKQVRLHDLMWRKRIELLVLLLGHDHLSSIWVTEWKGKEEERKEVIGSQ